MLLHLEMKKEEVFLPLCRQTLYLTLQWISDCLKLLRCIFLDLWNLSRTSILPIVIIWKFLYKKHKGMNNLTKNRKIFWINENFPRITFTTVLTKNKIWSLWVKNGGVIWVAMTALFAAVEAVIQVLWSVETDMQISFNFVEKMFRDEKMKICSFS